MDWLRSMLLFGRKKAKPNPKRTLPRRTKRRSLRRKSQRRSQTLQRKTRKRTMQRRVTQQRRITLPKKKAVLQRSQRILLRPRKKPRKPR